MQKGLDTGHDGVAGDVAGARVTGVYRVATGDGRSTEELVDAGNYGYAHSCATSESFPASQVARPPVAFVRAAESGHR